MGAFYANHTVCGPDLSHIEQIQEIRPAYILKTSGNCMVVFDQLSEMQAEPILEQTGRLLSKQPGTVVLSVVIHDDDIMFYWLSKEGELLQKYNSAPNYFEMGDPKPPEGGDAAELCKLFGTGDIKEVTGILTADLESERFVFATQRHNALAKALGLPEAAAGMSYSYIESGDFLKGLSAGDFRKLNK